jgi:tripartite-type tricarboxylate transporter receptor subunit TctC
MLAIGAPQRHPALPDIPTVNESGVPGYNALTWFGLFAPRGTPATLVDSLNEEVHRIFDDPAVRSKYLDKLFFEPIPGTAAEFAAYIDAERAKWQKIIRDAKVSVD